MARTPRVVIVGGGFGGLAAARSLKRAPVELALVDRWNHHLFQPLLYQVAMAGLSPANIAMPIRSILSKQANTTVLMDEVTAVDLGRRRVLLGPDHFLPYDFLVLSVGARTNYFGHEEWSQRALGLKSVDEAVEIRRQVLLAFEAAERTRDPREQQRLLTFVVIGGGPTGVELAGSLAELARFVLARDFRNVNAARARVILLEAAPRLLLPFDERLATAALQHLHELGVEVRLSTPVEGIEEGVVSLPDEDLPASAVLWAAGVRGVPLARTLGVPLDRAGRVIVAADCSVPGHPDAFVIGDAASFTPPGEQRALPGLAPVAMQQGRFVARAIQARLRGAPPGVFHYRDKGIMATVGRKRAVAQTRHVRARGFFAWLTWLVVHVLYLAGFRNRVIVMIEWMWNYATYKRGARLITGPKERHDGEALGPPPPRPGRSGFPRVHVAAEVGEGR